MNDSGGGPSTFGVVMLFSQSFFGDTFGLCLGINAPRNPSVPMVWVRLQMLEHFVCLLDILLDDIRVKLEIGWVVCDCTFFAHCFSTDLLMAHPFHHCHIPFQYRI